MSKSAIYKLWTGMRQRCENPNSVAFANYGARGISVCERWKTFENFYADMGDKPPNKTLDRKDNSLGYSPENCRWATATEQASNKRPKARQQNSTTGIPGVHWKPSHNRYVARATVEGKRRYLGFFKTREEAAVAVANHLGSLS